jgi:hypothetical protein
MTEMRTGRFVTGLMGSQVGRVGLPPASMTDIDVPEKEPA